MLPRIVDLGPSYAVNNAVGLYIKHASNSNLNGPWQFTFAPDHQQDIRKLFQRFDDRMIIALVCGRRGICLLTFGEYAITLQEDFNHPKVLKVRRSSGGGFRVLGSAGNMKRVISLNRFPGGLFDQKHK